MTAAPGEAFGTPVVLARGPSPTGYPQVQNVALSPRGDTAVAWSDDSYLYVALHGPGGEFGEPQRFRAPTDPDRYPQIRAQLAFDAKGRAVVAWYGRNTVLQVALRRAGTRFAEPVPTDWFVDDLPEGWTGFDVHASDSGELMITGAMSREPSSCCHERFHVAFGNLRTGVIGPFTDTGAGTGARAVVTMNRRGDAVVAFGGVDAYRRSPYGSFGWLTQAVATPADITYGSPPYGIADRGLDPYGNGEALVVDYGKSQPTHVAESLPRVERDPGPVTPLEEIPPVMQAPTFGPPREPYVYHNGWVQDLDLLRRQRLALKSRLAWARRTSSVVLEVRCDASCRVTARPTFRAVGSRRA